MLRHLKVASGPPAKKKLFYSHELSSGTLLPPKEYREIPRKVN